MPEKFVPLTDDEIRSKAVARLRQEHFGDDLTDDELLRTLHGQGVHVAEAGKNLGRAIRANLPGPLRRALGG